MQSASPKSLHFQRGQSHITIFRKKGQKKVSRWLCCMYCGKKLGKIDGSEIQLAIDCEVPEGEQSIQLLCDKGCNTLYTIY